MDPVVELRGVVKRFGACLAVDRLSLAVPRGQFYSILGPSGCGKTTTLRLTAGFERPDEGDVLIHGQRVNDLPPYRRSVSTVFQSYALFPHLTVAENVAFGLRQSNVPEPEIRLRVERALALVQLPGSGNRRPQLLSGGEKQRVALARSLVLEPDVLLLDEPLAALDQKLRRDVRLELKRLQRAVGITFLFVTHDQEDALILSDGIAVMNAGKLEQVGTPEEIYRRPQTRFVAGFIGSSNLICGRVTEVTGVTVELTTASGKRLRGESTSLDPPRNSQAALLVRPEAMRISNSSAPPEAQMLTGKVVQSVYLGTHQQITVEIEPGLHVTIHAQPANAPTPGSSIDIWWPTKEGLILSD